MPEYRYEDYVSNARPAPFTFKNIEVYFLDKIDWVLTKILAGRPSDFQDINTLVKSPEEVPAGELIERYKKITPAPGKENEVRARFETFVQEFYKKKE